MAENKVSKWMQDNEFIVHMLTNVVLNMGARTRTIYTEPATRCSVIVEKLFTMIDVATAYFEARLMSMPKDKRATCRQALTMVTDELLNLALWIQDPSLKAPPIALASVSVEEPESVEDAKVSDAELALAEYFALGIINTLTRYRACRDPVTRYCLILDKPLLVIEHLMGMSQAFISKMTPQAGDRCQKAINYVKEDLTFLSEWIQQPVHSPDHHVGKEVMQQAAKSFDTAKVLPLDAPSPTVPSSDPTASKVLPLPAE